MPGCGVLRCRWGRSAGGRGEDTRWGGVVGCVGRTGRANPGQRYREESVRREAPAAWAVVKSVTTWLGLESGGGLGLVLRESPSP